MGSKMRELIEDVIAFLILIGLGYVIFIWGWAILPALVE